MCDHLILALVGLCGTSYRVLMWKRIKMTSSLYQRIAAYVRGSGDLIDTFYNNPQPSIPLAPPTYNLTLCIQSNTLYPIFPLKPQLTFLKTFFLTGMVRVFGRPTGAPAKCFMSFRKKMVTTFRNRAKCNVLNNHYCAIASLRIAL